LIRVPLESGVDRHCGAIRAALERAGTPIGANDLLIAAHARTIQAVCVTANVGEFRRVPGLRVENWLD
jgi:tRNA(fMet)-specific endonuclease VapC